MSANKHDILKCIVCGFEHSGTTMLSDILRKHPELDSGFETGFLIHETPHDYINDHSEQNPWVGEHMLKRGWELTNKDIEDIGKCQDWNQAYSLLRERSPIIKNKTSLLFDKTPRYMAHLPHVAGRNVGIPIIVLWRDPRSLYHSWNKRNPTSLESFIKNYLIYASGLREAEALNQSPILSIQYEELCSNPKMITQKVFKFLNLETPKKTTSIDPKFGNTYGKNISKNYLFDYKNHLSTSDQEQLINATEAFKNYHFHNKSNFFQKLKNWIK